MKQYLYTLYFVFKGLVLIIASPFASGAAPLAYMGMGSLFIAAPLFALLEYHGRRRQ